MIVTETQDFNSAIKRAGYPKDEFEISEKEDPSPVGVVHAITGTVTVRNKRTGVERTYKAGHATAWVAEFEKDLQTGLFTKSHF
jgi:hypothetical protein